MGCDMELWAKINLLPKLLFPGHFITPKRHDTKTDRQCSDFFLLLSTPSGSSYSSLDVHSFGWILWWKLSSLLWKLHKLCHCLQLESVLVKYIGGCARGMSGCQGPPLLCCVSSTKLRSLWEVFNLADHVLSINTLGPQDRSTCWSVEWREVLERNWR